MPRRDSIEVATIPTQHTLRLSPAPHVSLFLLQVGLAAAWPWDKPAVPVEEDTEGNLLIPLALGAAIIVVLIVACSTKPREGQSPTHRPTSMHRVMAEDAKAD